MNLRLALALVGAASILTAGLGLYWKGRVAGVAAERPKVATALDRARVSDLEAEGAKASAARVEIVVRQREAATRTVSQLTPAILNSEAAHVALESSRGVRLRNHDHELCQLAGGNLTGCPAAP